MTVVGVPVKAFGVAKERLASVLDPVARAALGKRVADRTVRVASELVGTVWVVTGDDEVAAWAVAAGHDVLPEHPGGLDGAASAVVEAAGGRRWAVLHADLPLLSPADLVAALDGADRVVCPSSDGGTSLLVGRGRFRFAYGPGSFQRHLRAMPGARVVVRRGLALDLDTPADLAAVGSRA